MITIHVQVTKIIVVAVEAASYDEACFHIEQEHSGGDIGQSFAKAEPQMLMLCKEVTA